MQKDSFVRNCIKEKKKIDKGRKAEELSEEERKRINELKTAC